MYIVTKTLTRPNSNVSFMLMNDEPEVIKMHWYNTYRQSNKCLKIETTGTDNTLVFKMYWDSKQSYNDCVADQFLMKNLYLKRDRYYKKSGVVVSVSATEN